MEFCEINPFVRNVICVKAPLWEHYDRKGVDCRVFYVVKGSMNIFMDGQMHTVTKGGMIYISAGYKYALKEYSEDFVHYVVNFDFTQEKNQSENAFFPKRSEEFSESTAILPPEIKGFEFLKAYVIINNSSVARELFDGLYSAYSDKRVMYRHESSAYMKLIISVIAERAITKFENSGEAIAKSAIAYIKENYSDCLLNNEKISTHLGYNSFYVNKLVKKLTGKSIHKYLLRYRLTRAENLLIYSEKSITDISLCCGFSVYDVFYAAFKKEYGQTPTKFRKDNRRLI